MKLIKLTEKLLVKLLAQLEVLIATGMLSEVVLE
jgi:hypothetical protein